MRNLRITHPTRSSPRFCLVAALALLCPLGLCSRALSQTPPTIATTVPLVLPAGVAADAQGDLYFVESGSHVLRMVSSAGVLSTIAGTGVQGFAGDQGPATAALLDSPTALTLSTTNDLYFSDSHNHRIRRIDAASGIITTVAGTGAPGTSPDGTPAASALLDQPAALAFDSAGNLYFADAGDHRIRRIDHGSTHIMTVAGNGIQGFSGDGGPALSASIDTPSGLAIDAAGNIFLADSHNHRIRRVDFATSIITSVAGTGQPGFSGDLAPAASASLRLPRGLALSPAGDLYIVDSSNHRIRRIAAATGLMTTVVGNGVQAYAGDSAAASAASLDSPRAVALSPVSLPVLSDTGNRRIRQVDPAGDLVTVAGLGVTTSAITLTLTSPSVILYGTGAVTAKLNASPATGSVTFFDSSVNPTATLSTLPLAANSASLSTTTLAAGAHRLSATYPGDSQHTSAQSGALSLTIGPAPAVASPMPLALLYGQPIPTLAASLTGILPQDAGAVALALSTTAAALAHPGTYPITAALQGSGAGNYSLTTAPAAITIAKAASLTSLTSPQSGSLLIHVAPTTSGVATGTVSLADGSAPLATSPLSATGDASFSATPLTNGTHTLIATYPGSLDLLPSVSAPLLVTVGGAATTLPDFSLAATSQTTATIASGASATFAFAVQPVNGALLSPIQLTVSGLPLGATATFNPTYLPPSSNPAAFILTIQTPRTALLHNPLGNLASMPVITFAMLFPAFLLTRRRRAVPTLLCTLLFANALGCGDRFTPAAVSASARTYNIAVLATATSTAGTTLQHSASVSLVVQ